MVKFAWRSYRPFLPPSGMHLVLSIGVPWTQVLLVQAALARPVEEPLGLLYNLGALVCGLGGSLWKSWHDRRHLPWTWSAWSFLMALVGVYTLACGLNFQAWDSFFHLSWPKFLFASLFLVQIFLSIFWQSRLTSRGRIFARIRHLEGEALRAKIRDYHEDGSFSTADRRTLGVYLLVSALGFIGLNLGFTGGLTPYRLEPTLGFLALNLAAFALTGLYRQEMNSLVWGRRWSPREKWKRMALVGVLLGLSLGFGAWVTGLYAPKVEAQTLAKVYRIAPGPQSPDPVMIPQPEVPQFQGNSDFLFWLNQFLRLEWINWKGLADLGYGLAVLFLTVLPYILGAILIVPVVWALVRGRLNWRLLRYYWVAFWSQLLRALGNFFRWLVRRTPKGPAVLVPQSNQEIWLLGRGGKRPVRRLESHSPWVRGFIKILDWAQARKIKYFQGETTGEFLQRCAQKFPQAQESFTQVREVLDQGLFSPEAPNAPSLHLFHHHIKEILKLRK